MLTALWQWASEDTFRSTYNLSNKPKDKRPRAGKLCLYWRASRVHSACGERWSAQGRAWLEEPQQVFPTQTPSNISACTTECVHWQNICSISCVILSHNLVLLSWSLHAQNNWLCTGGTKARGKNQRPYFYFTECDPSDPVFLNFTSSTVRLLPLEIFWRLGWYLWSLMKFSQLVWWVLGSGVGQKWWQDWLRIMFWTKGAWRLNSSLHFGEGTGAKAGPPLPSPISLCSPSHPFVHPAHAWAVFTPNCWDQLCQKLHFRSKCELGFSSVKWMLGLSLQL